MIFTQITFKGEDTQGVWVYEKELIMELTMDDTLKKYSHKELMDDVVEFCRRFLVRTHDLSLSIPLHEILLAFERYSDRKVMGTPESIWVRRHIMRHYRITYDRSFSPKRAVVYGSLTKGLILLERSSE